MDLIKGGVVVDDRGEVRFVNDFDFSNVKRFYQVQNHEPGFIRAWHCHVKESKYVYVAHGSILLGVAPFNLDNELDIRQGKKYVLSATTPSVLYIPPAHGNGFMTLEKDTIVLFFSTSTLEESQYDDIRLPFDTWNLWNKVYR